MAQVERINVTIGGTIPTMNYGNVTLNIAYEIVLEAGDDPAQVVSDYLKQGKAEMTRQAIEIVRGKVRDPEKLLSYMASGKIGDVRELLKNQMPSLFWLQILDPDGEIMRASTEPRYVPNPDEVPAHNGRGGRATDEGHDDPYENS